MLSTKYPNISIKIRIKDEGNLMVVEFLFRTKEFGVFKLFLCFYFCIGLLHVAKRQLSQQNVFSSQCMTKKFIAQKLKL